MYQMLFGEAEDALVVKRPIQKWSCISCDKDLNSYKGKLGNYHNWVNQISYEIKFNLFIFLLFRQSSLQKRLLLRKWAR